MSKPIVTISRATIKIWGRELAATFHTPTKNIIYFSVLLLVAITTLSTLLAIITVNGFNAEIPDNLKTTVYRTSISTSITLAGLVSTIICLTTPSSTALNTLLDLLPISKKNAFIGIKLPQINTGLIFSLPMSTMVFLIIIRLGTTTLNITLSIATIILIILCTIFTIVGIYTITHHAIRKYIKLPYNYATAISGLIMILLTLLPLIGETMNIKSPEETDFMYWDLLPHRIAAGLVTNSSSITGWISLASWGLLGMLIFILSGRFYDQNINENPLILFKKLSPGMHPKRGSLWFSLQIAARTPHFITMTVLPILILTVVVWNREHPILVQLLPNISTLLPTLPCYLAIYAVGRILNLQWLGTMMTGSHKWWIWSTILVYALYSLLTATVIVIAQLLLSFTTFAHLPDIYSKVSLALTAALVSGALVPYSEQQPMTTIAGGIVSLTIVLASLLLLSLVPSAAQISLVPLLRLILSIILCWSTFMICKRIQHGTLHAS